MSDGGLSPTRGLWDRYGRFAELLLLGGIAAFLVVRAQTKGRRRSELGLGETAPAVTLPLLRGGKTVVGGTPGQVVLLDFWATWCVPCVKSMPELGEVGRQFEGRPLRVVLVNQDFDAADRRALVRSFVSSKNIDLPVAIDNGKAQWAYRVERLPYTFLLDKDGTIRHRWAGPTDAETLARLIEGLL